MRSQVRILVRPLSGKSVRYIADLSGTITQHGDVAQLGERLPCTQEVVGSIPVVSTKKKTTVQMDGGFFWLPVLMCHLFEECCEGLCYLGVALESC